MYELVHKNMRFYIKVTIIMMTSFLLASCEDPEKPVVCSVIKGLESLHGRDGRDGLPGIKGEIGFPGQTGSPGLKGNPGPPGKAGPQGLKGDRGDKGMDGTTGPQGLKGEKGSLGPSGATGAVGVPGAKGATGAAGAPGTPGVKGAAGAKGDKGDQGLQGIKGEKGSTGATGASGTPGAAGAKGATGAAGPQGIQGVKGSAGAKGDKGDPAVITNIQSKLSALEAQVNKLQLSISAKTKALLFTRGATVGEKTFVTSGKEVTYDESKAMCLKAGGQIASPRNFEENTAVLNVAQYYGLSPYLGITDIQTEGTFRYPDGKSITYSNWNTGEPNQTGEEDYVEMLNTGKWNDGNGQHKRLNICEFY